MYADYSQNRDEDGLDSKSFRGTNYKQGRFGGGFGSSLYSGNALSPLPKRIQKDLYGNPSTQYKQQTDFQKKFAQEDPDTLSESSNSSQPAIRIRSPDGQRDGDRGDSPRGSPLQENELDNFEKVHALSPEDQKYYFKNLYQPRDPDNFDMKELAKDPSVQLKKTDNTIFYGQTQDNKRHGKGVLLHTDGRMYEGEWENDQKHGKGYEEFPNGSTYEGEYANGKPEGVGTYKYYNGESYEGDWLNGVKHGNGIWRGKENDSYVGEWKNGKPDGYGVHTWVNGDRYEGEFKQSLKHGEGTEKFANGDVYMGNYASGKPDGYGEYYWANGSFFKGYFKNGLREGNGVWKRSVGDSDSYEGQYVGDKKSGMGVFTWASGNKYQGHYIDDLRHGYGEMQWADGSYYKGQWEKGIQHGEGEMCMPGQPSKKGLFENNIFIGSGNEGGYSQQQQPMRQNSIGPDSTRGKKNNWNPSASTQQIAQSPQPSFARKQSNGEDLILPDIHQKGNTQQSRNNTQPLQRQKSTASNYFNNPEETQASNGFYDSQSPVKSPQKRNLLDSQRTARGPILAKNLSNETPMDQSYAKSPQKNRNLQDSSRTPYGPVLAKNLENDSPSSNLKKQATYNGAAKVTHSRQHDEGGLNSSRNSSLKRSGYDSQNEAEDMRRTLRANQKYQAAVSNRPSVGTRQPITQSKR